MFNTKFLAQIRAAELDILSQQLADAPQRILEIGGGTGQQAKMLTDMGHQVTSIEVKGSIYAAHQVHPILQYDGVRLPFKDRSFDVILSSNVLEHVQELSLLEVEMKRVLRPDGFGLHAVPTHAWRIWTSLAHYVDLIQRSVGLLRAASPRSAKIKEWLGRPLLLVLNLGRIWLRGLLPQRHGERGNVFTEIYYFHPSWWRRHYSNSQYSVTEDYPMGIFYTGYMVLGERMGMAARRRFSHYLGSACHVFVVKYREVPPT